MKSVRVALLLAKNIQELCFENTFLTHGPLPQSVGPGEEERRNFSASTCVFTSTVIMCITKFDRAMLII
jgi:hypothetical protein